MLLDPTPFSELRELRNSSGDNCLQPYELSRLIQQCSDLQNRRCGFVYWSLFPADRGLEMHVADNDTLASVRIYNKFLQVSSGWLQ
jgi:hypothetical protein